MDDFGNSFCGSEDEWVCSIAAFGGVEVDGTLDYFLELWFASEI